MATTLTAPGADTGVVEQTRLRALILQLEFALRYTSNVEWWLPQMAHGLENRWLVAIGVYGLAPDQRAGALLDLNIDWTSHDTERRAGRFLVSSTKDKQPEGATSLVTAAARWFRAVVAARELRTQCRVWLTNEVEDDRKLRARVHRELTCTGTPHFVGSRARVRTSWRARIPSCPS